MHFWGMSDSGEAGVIIKQLTRHSTLRNRSLYEKNACWVGILSGGRRYYHYCYCWYGLTFHLADALSNNQWRNKTDKSRLKDQLTESLNSNRMLLVTLFSLLSIVASENEVITITQGVIQKFAKFRRCVSRVSFGLKKFGPSRFLPRPKFRQGQPWH